MEMGEPVSPFQLGELALVSFDAATAGLVGTGPAKAAYKWLTKTVNKSPEEAFTIMKNNPQLADDDMVGKSIDELTDEEYDKLNIGAAVPPRGKKKKTAAAVTTKEAAFPGGLPLKSFDESLLATKPLKDAPKLKPKAAQLTDEVKTKIGSTLEKTNFSKLDLKADNPYLNIVNKERAAAGYQPTNTPVSMHAKNLQKQGYITKAKQEEITAYQKKRSQANANEAYMQQSLIKNTEKANKAVRLAKELQEASESQIVMPMATFYDQLVKAFPDDFKPLTSVSSKNKIITTLKTLKPEIKTYLARPGSEVGGLKYSDETLGVIEGGEEAARRSELVDRSLNKLFLMNP